MSTTLFDQSLEALDTTDITASCGFNAFGYEGQSIVDLNSSIDIETQGQAPHLCTLQPLAACWPSFFNNCTFVFVLFVSSVQFNLPQESWVHFIELVCCDGSKLPASYTVDLSDHLGRSTLGAISIDWTTASSFGRLKTVRLVPTHVNGASIYDTVSNKTKNITIGLSGGGKDGNVRLRTLRVFSGSSAPVQTALPAEQRLFRISNLDVTSSPLFENAQVAPSPFSKSTCSLGSVFDLWLPNTQQVWSSPVYSDELREHASVLADAISAIGLSAETDILAQISATPDLIHCMPVEALEALYRFVVQENYVTQEHFSCFILARPDLVISIVKQQLAAIVLAPSPHDLAQCRSVFELFGVHGESLVIRDQRTVYEPVVWNPKGGNKRDFDITSETCLSKGRFEHGDIVTDGNMTLRIYGFDSDGGCHMQPMGWGTGQLGFICFCFKTKYNHNFKPVFIFICEQIILDPGDVR